MKKQERYKWHGLLAIANTEADRAAAADLEEAIEYYLCSWCKYNSGDEYAACYHPVDRVSDDVIGAFVSAVQRKDCWGFRPFMSFKEAAAEYMVTEEECILVNVTIQRRLRKETYQGWFSVCLDSTRWFMAKGNYK